MITARPCKNDPNKLYLGTEMSPLRFGDSASGYDIDTIKMGYDKVNWIVKMKNNRKVWIRHLIPNKMVHEEMDAEEKSNIIEEEKPKEKDTKIDNVKVAKTSKKEKVEDKTTEKKMTNYNIFLTYRLNELKQKYAQDKIKKTKKDIFSEVVAEWKALDKKSEEFKEIMKKAQK